MHGGDTCKTSVKKNNPTQAFHGAMFNMSQGKVSQWLKILLPLLEKSLARMKALPSGIAEKFYLSLKVLGHYFILLYATERLSSFVLKSNHRYKRRSCKPKSAH